METMHSADIQGNKEVNNNKSSSLGKLVPIETKKKQELSEAKSTVVPTSQDVVYFNEKIALLKKWVNAQKDENAQRVNEGFIDQMRKKYNVNVDLEMPYKKVINAFLKEKDAKEHQEVLREHFVSYPKSTDKRGLVDEMHPFSQEVKKTVLPEETYAKIAQALLTSI